MTNGQSCAIMEHMIEYCLGFAFNPSLDTVVLIKKQRPEWQAGLLNGVGGKLEPGESAMDAMHREFKEETGVSISDWQRFGQLSGSDWIVHLYTTKIYDWEIASIIYKKTDEEILLKDADNLSNIIPNLMWLVPMAKYSLITGEAFIINEINLYQ